MSTRIDRLEHHRTWLWAVLTGAISLAAFAIGSIFFILDDRIQSRFDVADERNREISREIGDLKTGIAIQSNGIERLLERTNDDKSEARD